MLLYIKACENGRVVGLFYYASKGTDFLSYFYSLVLRHKSEGNFKVSTQLKRISINSQFSFLLMMLTLRLLWNPPGKTCNCFICIIVFQKIQEVSCCIVFDAEEQRKCDELQFEIITSFQMKVQWTLNNTGSEMSFWEKNEAFAPGSVSWLRNLNDNVTIKIWSLEFPL